MALPKRKTASVVELNPQEWDSYFEGHNQRLDSIDQMSQKLEHDIRDMRTGQQTDTQYLNSRIDKVQETLSFKLDQQTTTLSSHIDAGLSQLVASQKDSANRITNLETWRTLIVGGAIVAFAVIGDVLVRILYGPVGKYIGDYFLPK